MQREHWIFCIHTEKKWLKIAKWEKEEILFEKFKITCSSILLNEIVVKATILHRYRIVSHPKEFKLAKKYKKKRKKVHRQNFFNVREANQTINRTIMRKRIYYKRKNKKKIKNLLIKKIRHYILLFFVCYMDVKPSGIFLILFSHFDIRLNSSVRFSFPFFFCSAAECSKLNCNGITTIQFAQEKKNEKPLTKASTNLKIIGKIDTRKIA